MTDSPIQRASKLALDWLARRPWRPFDQSGTLSGRVAADPVRPVGLLLETRRRPVPVPELAQGLQHGFAEER